MRYAYEGWNLIAEWDMTVSPPQLVRTHHWGIDLSGTREGAGGVGGLVMTRLHALPGQPGVKATIPTYDGTGNIIAYLDTADGKPVAENEYGPFGEALRQTGPLASELPHRWSSKFTDEETGLSYYGYRYYSPVAGRWLSRDPIGERGGVGLYGFVGNSPVFYIDVLGLMSGEIIVDISCRGMEEVLSRITYFSEDENPKVHRRLPAPGQKVTADAIYWGNGTATKIPDTGTIIIRCFRTSCGIPGFSFYRQNIFLPFADRDNYIEWPAGTPTTPPRWPGTGQGNIIPHNGAPAGGVQPPLNPQAR